MSELGRRRVAVVVIDACGVGALPDADSYGDAGSNTLAHLAEAVGGLDLPVLGALGLGCILPLAGVPPARQPVIHGRLHPLGPGKDSTAGHWELMGVVATQAPPTYPGGFPSELIARLTRAMGHEVICNRPYNGIAAIEDFGAEHLGSGRLILYTSQDSVLQLAGHVNRIAPEELYRACVAARAQMCDEHAVGRVIARPFSGRPGDFRRTDGRRDFSLAPPRRSYLDELVDAGVPVHGVGKIRDLFAGAGITEHHAAAANRDGLQVTAELLDELEHGLIFTNLVETDQTFGHRKDTEGFHRALQEIDRAVGEWRPALRGGDLLVITADHGVDPASPGTDHTREYVPLLAVSAADAAAGGGGHPRDGGRPIATRHDGPMADVGATALRWLSGRETGELPGRPFAP